MDTDEHLHNLTNFINKVPSKAEQAVIWSEFAQRCYFNKRQDLCKRLVNEHLIPILSSNLSKDEYNNNQIFPYISPALYFSHNNTCLELIKELPDDVKELCYVYICKSILEKVPSTEPFDKPPETVHKNIDLNDLLDLTKILELTNTDNSIYMLIDDISMILSSKEYRSKFNYTQRADIKRRLQNIINDKLPDKNNIQHEGYKISAEACLGSIDDNNTAFWDSLLVRTRNISNLADKVFVLTVVANKLPSSLSNLKRVVYEEAKQLIASMPIFTDKIERFHFWSSQISSFDEIEAKKCIKEVFNLIGENANSETNSVQKKLIDLAYQIDSDFASALASTSSNDPAVISSNSQLSKQIQRLKIKEKMMETTEKKNRFSPQERSFASDGAWKNLSRLNSSRLMTKRTEELLPWMILSSEFAINKAYPFLCWYIENAVRRFSNTNSAVTDLLPLFNSITEGIVVCEKITIKSSEKEKAVKIFSNNLQEKQSMLVRAGGRESAIEFIKNWISHDVEDYLKICDPYFGIEDLSLLQIIKEYNPNCKVRILTSKFHNKNVPPPIDEEYINYWKRNLSDQNPPETEIVISGLKSSGKLPIHDRWWITKNSGLRVGTSFNSLGMSKDSEISVLTEIEIQERETQIDLYLERREKEHNGEKINYFLFEM